MMDECTPYTTRSRKTVLVQNVQVDKDDDESSSSDDSSDSFESPSKKSIKKRGKRTVAVYKPPVQKLKRILAEKTQQLKKKSLSRRCKSETIKKDKLICDVSDSVVEKDKDEAVKNDLPKIEHEDRTDNNNISSHKHEPKPVVSNEIGTIDCVEILDDDDDDDDVIFVENSLPIPAIIPKLEKIDDVAPTSDTKSKVSACENEVSSSIFAPAKQADEIPAATRTKMTIAIDKSEKISIKEETPIVEQKSIKKEIVAKRDEPIVVTLSTSKNSPYITPYLLPTDLPGEDPPSCGSVPVIPPQMPQSPNISSSTKTCMTPTSSPAPSQSPSTTPSTGVARLRINPNLQASPAFETSLVNNNFDIVPQPQTQRPRGQRTPRRRESSRAPRGSFTGPHSSIKPRKLFVSNDTRQARPRPRPRPQPSSRSDIEIISHKKNLPITGISASNISSAGTVLYSGSGSVTITPRKKRPERSSLGRQLIRPEVEGIIVCKEERGIYRYALRLANGTHYPLSGEQINALRKQNNGVLPTKLQIPVPSDVASQVEPRFVIED